MQPSLCWELIQNVISTNDISSSLAPTLVKILLPVNNQQVTNLLNPSNLFRSYTKVGTSETKRGLTNFNNPYRMKNPQRLHRLE
jgi:uncharacterized membrane protein YukC